MAITRRTATLGPIALALSLAAFGSVSPAAAYDALTAAETRALIVGHTVSFEGGGRATFNADGSYVFRGRGTWRGRYSISGNRVCVDFDNGNRRCDRFVKRGKRYYLINADGRRFRARVR